MCQMGLVIFTVFLSLTSEFDKLSNDKAIALVIDIVRGIGLYIDNLADLATIVYAVFVVLYADDILLQGLF